jgi:hypothetical protein
MGRGGEVKGHWHKSKCCGEEAASQTAVVKSNACDFVLATHPAATAHTEEEKWMKENGIKKGDSRFRHCLREKVPSKAMLIEYAQKHGRGKLAKGK